MYHVKFYNVLPGKHREVLDLEKASAEVLKKFEGVETVGLFFPRGSDYRYARIIKCRDYATWEKYWRSPDRVYRRDIAETIVTNQMDMFFDEIKIE